MDRLGGAGRYRIVMDGELGDRFAAHFDGMDLTRLDGTTVLTGGIIDQAQLIALVQRGQELGLDLISVQRVPLDPAEAAPEAQPGRSQPSPTL